MAQHQPEAAAGPASGRRDAGQTGSDHPELADLRSSLTSLSTLATGQLSLQDTLTRVATFAVHAIPGADGAGLVLLEQRHSNTMVATDPFVGEVDAIQYGLGEGPSISAAAERRIIRSGSLGADPRWPTFGPLVDALGVRSVLALPLLTPDGVLGALNVYAHATNVFDDHAAAVGEAFAIPAAVAVQNAHALALAKRLAVNLQTALSNQRVVNQAVGMLRDQTGWTAAEAVEHLRSMGRTQQMPLVVAAQTLMEQAVRAAQRWPRRG